MRACLAGQGDASPPPLHLGSDHTHQVGIREEGKVSDSRKLWIQCETNFSRTLFLTYMKNQGASNQLHIWEHPPDCQGRPWHNA